MLSISNDTLALRVSENGSSIQLEDRRRKVTWEIASAGFDDKPPAGRWTHSPLVPFSDGSAKRISDKAIDVSFSVPGGQAVYTWEMLADGVDIRLNVKSDKVLRISMPGSFRPLEGGLELLVPVNQGALLRPVGVAHHYRNPIGGGAMLSMLGYLADRGALVAAQEDARDNFILHGDTGRGVYGLFELERCPVDGWYERRTRVYAADRGVTPVCKRYRHRLIERGDFVDWNEKIRRKPIVEKLFGSLIAFIGYMRGRETDYARSARALRDFGFGTVFYYPVRFNSLDLDYQAGGDPVINLPDEVIRAMKDAGGVLAPWTWTYETIDHGVESIQHGYRLDAEGKRIPHWQIDDQTWYKTCTQYQADYLLKQYAGVMKEMGWTHFDVSSTRGGECCFNRAHEKHGNRPMPAREDQMNVARLMSAEVNGDRVVSSEGFNDFFARWYEIGSNKFMPAWGRAAHVHAPLTGLVLHDSTLHNWWEIDTYNAVRSSPMRFAGMGVRGSGMPEKKAAMDALYGCPPLVFPFGRQYGYVPGKGMETYSYEVHLEEPEVQRALRAALPVARLHKKIGKCEMVDFGFVTEDAAVQTTLFSDGTRVVANVSDEERETDYGRMAPDSWKVV
jgi:hypothetical protein